MRKLFSLLSCLLFFHFSQAQLSTLSGTVRDTAENIPLHQAVVMLLQKKDSTLYKVARSGKNGTFRLENVSQGSYVFVVTFPGFAGYADSISVNESNHDLGVVALTQKAKLLQAVIIKSAGAIRIKGDTTEFVADSFKVREGATVEELLKRLPGFQVNSKGEIVAQGQRVDKVLVDGEEFFGDDPIAMRLNFIL